MSRYIDAEYVKAVMINDRLMQGNAEFNLYAQQVEIQINAMPSIDIVRCDECQYYEDGHCESAEMWQSINGNTTECESMSRNADDFCSYGERREP